MKPLRRFAYNFPWRSAALCGLILVGLLVLIFRLAENISGIALAGLIAPSAVFAAVGLLIAIRRLAYPRTLVLDEETILFPGGILQVRTTPIPYADIIRIGESARPGLWIQTETELFELIAIQFPDNESYQKARDYIYSRLPIDTDRLANVGPSERNVWELKPILQWREPEDWPLYRTHLFASRPLWGRVARELRFFIRCYGIVLLVWLPAQLLANGTISPAEFPWFAIPFLLFFTLLHWLHAVHPVHSAQISCREQSLIQDFGKQTLVAKYSGFSGWAMIERPFEGRVLHIALLKRRDRVIAIALPNSEIRDRLAQLLRDKLVLETSDLQPSWESSP